MGTALLTSALSTTIAACGSPAKDAAAEPRSESPTTSDRPPSRELELRSALGVDEAGLVDVDGVECEVSDVLTSTRQIKAHISAGDFIVRNPDNNRGVVLAGDDPDGTCSIYFMGKLQFL